MLKKILVTSLFLTFGFLVLVVSILRSASLRHSSNFSPPSSRLEGEQKLSVNYYFASAGGVLPDHPLWVVKVLRDKFWLFLTPGPTRKSELNLLFSDKRLMAAKTLSQKGKYDLAYSVILKSHNYFVEAANLEDEARKGGDNTDELLLLLTKASLAHKEMIQSLQDSFPEDLRTGFPSIIEYLSGFYDRSSSYLKSKNIIIQ
ncbi:MAG: hypothetical protein CH104c_0765 [Candidatus Woesebacteria bacterium]|nr:MAG: hypothetical protein CH104c_0765 [Candidatus Woesebacteria bacterium]